MKTDVTFLSQMCNVSKLPTDVGQVGLRNERNPSVMATSRASQIVPDTWTDLT